MVGERQGRTASADQVNTPRARAAAATLRLIEPARHPPVTPRLIAVVVAILTGRAMRAALVALPR